MTSKKSISNPIFAKFHPSLPKFLLTCPKTTKLKHVAKRKSSPSLRVPFL